VPTVISRRKILKGAGAAAFLGASSVVLPMFGTPSRKQTPQSCPSVDLSGSQKELIISSWPSYLDPIDEPGSTLAGFERETGISVVYTEDISSNLTFFAKVINQLGSCQSINRDLFFLNTFLASRMINLGWLQELDHANLPNVEANLLPKLRQPAYDPGRRFTVPWQSGFTGIAYNAALVGEVGSFADLLSRDELRGRITLFDELQDTMPFFLKLAGADPTRYDDNDWHNALELLGSVRRRGQIRAFTGNDFRFDLAAGNVAACLAWSGDILQLQFDNPDIRFVVPEEGLVLWSDNFLVPNQAAHKTNAEKWINYYYEPEVSARAAAFVKCICPVAGAREAMVSTAPELVDNPLIFPSDEILSQSFEPMPLDETQERRYQAEFAEAMGG
jgi:spermidine/putrescine transport system substrate-binding protein